ncbi:hypothetical protein ACIOHE_01380 [Streptomyces sp. NPDC087851]|uniref:hypothetical protein n=1 Tax=Streptomyces sp. NPDC087851 TaxID=3365810 RepID=UPI0037FD3909
MLSPAKRAGVIAAAVLGVVGSAPHASAAVDPLAVKFTNQRSALCIRLQDGALIGDCFGTSGEMNWTLVPIDTAPVEYRYIRSNFNGSCPAVSGSTLTLSSAGCTSGSGTARMWQIVRYEPGAPPAGMAGVRMESIVGRKCMDTDAANDWAIVPGTCSNTSTSQQWNIPLDKFNALFG